MRWSYRWRLENDRQIGYLFVDYDVSAMVGLHKVGGSGKMRMDPSQDFKMSEKDFKFYCLDDWSKFNTAYRKFRLRWLKTLCRLPDINNLGINHWPKLA